MATRSAIGVLNSNGSVTAIYCHWDGYPDGVGRTLTQHWCDDLKISSLMALGSISVLGWEIGKKQDFDARWDSNDPQSNWCVAYGRDRGEEETDARVHSNEHVFRTSMAVSGCQYFYLWQDGKWLVSDGVGWSDLKLEEAA